MSDKPELKPTPVTDEGILKQCRDALNKWSRKLPFAVARKLGDDGEFLSASMYHAYTFKIATEFAQRKFVLEKGGNPVDNPTPIECVNMWNIGGAELNGEYKVGLPFTCYAKTCDKCGGDGKIECGKCNGQGEVKCSHCHGHGVEKCGACGGTGEDKCSNCNGYGYRQCDVCGNGGKYGIIVASTHDPKYNANNPCPRCHNSNKVSCHSCGGTGKKTCTKCHGTGELRCKTCHETGHVKCATCKGTGLVLCSHCDGKGYISYMYHLVQKQGSDSAEFVWGDTGIGELLKYKKYEKYQGIDLLARRVEDDEQVSVDELPESEAEFIAELKAKWQEFYSRYDGVEDKYLRFEEVKIRQVDAAIRYEYKYKEKTYIVWIDLTSGKVFETEDHGLMTEWGKKIASEGRRYSGKNPQMAIFNYAMACAITNNNVEHAKKIRGQLILCSWLFRLAAGGLGGWLWSVFMGAQGADPLSGWYIMGAMIFLDILFAQKQFWMQLVGAGGVYGVIRYLLPYFYTQQIASDGYLQSYLMSAVLMFVGGTLLFARDLALRIRGGVFVFPILGALVGGATAPGMYLDFAEKPELMVQIMTYISYGLCGLAILRTWKRYWVQNCGWIAQKVNGGLARFETNMLKPRFWPMAIHLLVFAAAGYAWYMYAGPGVSVEMKARVADRFLRNERTRAKGKFYLAEAVRAEYLPAISQLAELQIMGRYGYAEDPKAGYELAQKAGDKGDAKSWRLQGYCLEYGKGQEQNLTAANARYAKAVELGDKEAVSLKEKTEEIARVWDLAHGQNNDAQYKLAVCYANGNGIAKDDGIARQWLLKAADAGHVKSQLLVSEWLIKGIGGAKDPETGVKYCEKAAMQDDPEATAVLGYYYFDGKIIPQDYQKAIESFNRACDKGSESAAYMLGYCYKEGLGVETNAVKAFEYFKLADERKSLPGAYALGVAYENGVGVSVDYTEALEGYTRSCEAEWEDPLTGNTTANAKTGCDRIGEIGKYWKSANAENNAEAQYHVGRCFANGTGVAKNLETAYGWYVKSAEQNFTEGIVSMADALFYGRGVSEDKAAAAKAYERGNLAGDVHSTYMLAVSYENGYGFKKNLTIAFTLYGKAAEKEYAGASDAAKVIALPAQYWDDAMEKNDAIAQYKLGCCYSRGNCGVDKDDSQAFKLFKKSADQGNADALYAVALCYRDGIGTSKNEGERKKALFAAAKKSHVASLATLGDLYRDGTLVSRDFTKALDCFNKAVAGGLETAKSSAMQINKIGLYWKSANDGDAGAQFNLGVCYRDGVQISVNEDDAILWFEKSAVQGNHEAEYAFAEMLSRRQPSSDATDKKIVGLLQKAVAANHIKAKTLLGKYLYVGKGIDEDYNQAVKLWEDAVHSGDLDAKCELAGFHFTGRGMFNSGKDQDRALKEWTEAAAVNHIESTFKLGQYYAGGSGLFSSGKDISKAKQYLLVAAKAGHRQAMMELADILNDSNNVAEKQKGESWLAKSKMPIKAIGVAYRITVADTVDGMARRVVGDVSVAAPEAARLNQKDYSTETITQDENLTDRNISDEDNVKSQSGKNGYGGEDSLEEIKPHSMARSRTPGSIGAVTRGGDSYGDASTESAVLKALRWLKTKQKTDGSWDPSPISNTGLAILCYLAHGETPQSKEFGSTVENAIQFLINSQYDDGGRVTFRGKDANEYATLIATYALVEAYGMTKNPDAKEAALKSVARIVNNQSPTGGWDYKMNKESTRDDMSYAGWALQALNACKLARLHPEGLDECINKAMKCLETRNFKDGGFSYTAGGAPTGLTATGCLAMQLLGFGDRKEVSASLDTMREWLPTFDKDFLKVNGRIAGPCPQYYCYYASQCKCQAGMKQGATPEDVKSWWEWNVAMKKLYTSTINTIEGEYEFNGKEYKIGYWTNNDDHGAGEVMSTCLCALQLMVYYRYPPTNAWSTTTDEDVHIIDSKTTPSKDDNPIGNALGDPMRVWITGGKPSKEGEDVKWHVSNHGNTAGREVYVGSGAGGAGRAVSYLHTKVTGPCKISFAYRIGTYKGHAIVLCDKEELMHFNDVADAKFDWKEATYEIPAGDHLLAFAYIHPGRGFTNHFSGFLIADFKVSPVE